MHLHAAQALDQRRIKRDIALRVRCATGHVHVAGFATTKFDHVARREVETFSDIVRVHAALEAVAGIRVDTQLPSRARRANGIEPGALDEDVRGRFRDTGGFATHDAGEAQHAAVISDDAHFLVERVGLAIQRQQRLALAGEAGVDLTLELVGVIDVQRTRTIQRDQVRDVDEGGDRAQADGLEPLLQPGWRGHVLHATHEASGEYGTGVLRRVFKAQSDLDRVVEARVDPDRLFGLEAAEARCRQVTRDATHAGAVRAVGCQLDLDDRIEEAEHFREGLAHGGVGRQVDDAVMFLAQPHLAFRAEHAIGFDAADRRLLQFESCRRNDRSRAREHALHAGARVRCAADDLELFSPGVDDADAQLVGVRVLLGGHDVGHGEGGEVLCLVFNAFDLETDMGERVGDPVDGSVGVEVILEPGEGELHWRSPFHFNCPSPLEGEGGSPSSVALTTRRMGGTAPPPISRACGATASPSRGEAQCKRSSALIG